MTSYLIITLILLNFFGDIGLQSTGMLFEKTKNFGVLVKHSLIYSLSIVVSLIIFHLVPSFNLGPELVSYFYIKIIPVFLLLFLFHILVDHVLGKTLEKAWFENRKKYIILVEFDEIIHLSILLLIVQFVLFKT